MKKIIPLILCFVMVFSLVACTNARLRDEEEGSAAKDLLRTNAAGDGLTWNGALPLVPEGEEKPTITIGLMLNSLVLDYDTNEYTKWVEEQTGVNLEFVTFTGTGGDFATQLALMIGGEEKLPDIIFNCPGLTKARGREYGRDGYLVDLSQYMITDSYYLHDSIRRVYGDQAEEKWDYIYECCADLSTNAFYPFPGMWYSPRDRVLGETWINRKWLDAVGKDIPTNIDELYDVLVAFRDEDPNGNGKKDEIPALGMDVNGTPDFISYITNAFIYVNTVDKFILEDGIISSPYVMDEYRDALRYINKLVKEGLLSPSSWTMKRSEIAALVNPPGGTYLVGITSDDGGFSFEAGGQSGFDFVPMYPLADATGKGGYAPMLTDVVQYASAITHSCENPQLAFRLLDFIASQDSFLRQRYGVKDVDWEFIENAPEGSGNFGGTAKIRLLNNNVYYQMNNQNWHASYTINGELIFQHEVDWEDTDSWEVDHAKKMLDRYNAYCKLVPDEVIHQFARTEEEDARYTEVSVPLNNYIEKARAMFCIGEWDIDDDAKWQEYLNELDKLGLHSDLIAVAQSAYNRKHGIN